MKEEKAKTGSESQSPSEPGLEDRLRTGQTC